MHTTVDNRLFDRLQAILTAHNQLTEGQDKISFQCYRVVILRVVQVDVHRVDIVGTGGASYIPLPIYRGILPCCFPVSTHVPWFSPIYPRLNFPLLSFETYLTIRQNSLHVTVCMIARTSYQGYFIHSLSTLYYYNAPSLATRLTGDYRDRTCTGKCGPALLDTQ